MCINERDITYQWVHDDIYPDPKHFEKGSFLNFVLQIMLCIPNKQTWEQSQYVAQNAFAKVFGKYLHFPYGVLYTLHKQSQTS